MDAEAHQGGIIEAMLADINGVLRGKWLPLEARAKLFQDGLRLPRSACVLDIWGRDVPASGLVFDTGDNDGVCRPVSQTLHPVPWLQRPARQVLLTMYESDGRPFFGDPRQVLARVLARYQTRGWTPVLATELEFHLLDRDATPAGGPQPPLAPHRGARLSDPQLYGMDELQQFEPVLSAIADACRQQDIPSDTVIAENAPGQFEVNLQHVPDALRAAEHALLLKRAIKGVSRSHGLGATFMAKPYGGSAGNGMHVHFSLLNDSGVNLFDSYVPSGDRIRQQAIAGLLATLPDCMALLAPHANSYRRFQAGSHAPLSLSWGHDNRTTALRLPESHGPAARIEQRVAGADANPYLVLAALLAGAWHGIVNALEPPPATRGNAYRDDANGLAHSWEQALQAFERSEFVAEAFGSDYQRLFSACKRQEQATLASRISDVEYQAYLHTV